MSSLQGREMRHATVTYASRLRAPVLPGDSLHLASNYEHNIMGRVKAAEEQVLVYRHGGKPSPPIPFKVIYYHIE